MFKIRLYELRKEHNMTQDKLGEHLNLTKQTICGYEKGVSEPGIDTLVVLSKLFDCSVDYLLGLSNLKKIAENELQSIQTAKTKMIKIKQDIDELIGKKHS